MKSSEAAEMYLETILIINARQGCVRSVDIANEMGYSKPTISEQMKKFRAGGLVEIASDGCIALTDKGLEIARHTYAKHNVIARFFIKLGVNEKTAFEDACRVEHYISNETFECIKKELGE